MIKDLLSRWGGWAILTVLVVANPEGAGDAILTVVDTAWVIIKTVFEPLFTGLMSGLEAVNRDASLGGN